MGALTVAVVTKPFGFEGPRRMRLADEGLAALASMVDISPSMAFKTKTTYPYGMGFEEITVAGQVAWGHRGYLDGFWSAMEYLPAYHVSVVVLSNADWADPVAAASTLAKIAIG